MRRWVFRGLASLVALLSCGNAAPTIAQGTAPLGSPFICTSTVAPLTLLAETDDAVSPLLGNLGEHHMPITTKSALAQRYFDEGIVLA